MPDNLPDWPGAATVYSRAYKILAHMGRSGAVAVTYRGRRTIGSSPSAEMLAAIDALNRGDEEACKAFVLANLHIVFAE